MVGKDSHKSRTPMIHTEISKFNSRERRAYEQSVNAYRDIKNGMDTSRKEGLQQGLQQGILQGERNTNLKNAKTMKAMGLPVETIQRITGLTTAEIDVL